MNERNEPTRNAERVLAKPGDRFEQAVDEALALLVPEQETDDE